MDPSHVACGWRKSSHSNMNGCVEVAVVDGRIAVMDGVVTVRSSRDPHGSVLEFTTHEWQAFLDGVRSGEFDLP